MALLKRTSALDDDATVAIIKLAGGLSKWGRLPSGPHDKVTTLRDVSVALDCYQNTPKSIVESLLQAYDDADACYHY